MNHFFGVGPDGVLDQGGLSGYGIEGLWELLEEVLGLLLLLLGRVSPSRGSSGSVTTN